MPAQHALHTVPILVLHALCLFCNRYGAEACSAIGIACAVPVLESAVLRYNAPSTRFAPLPICSTSHQYALPVATDTGYCDVHAGGNDVLLYAAEYDDVPTVVNIAGR